jgi:hypothetical protein
MNSQGWLKVALVRKVLLKLGALQPIGYSTSDFSGPAVTKSRICKLTALRDCVSTEIIDRVSFRDAK